MDAFPDTELQAFKGLRTPNMDIATGRLPITINVPDPVSTEVDVQARLNDNRFFTMPNSTKPAVATDTTVYHQNHWSAPPRSSTNAYYTEIREERRQPSVTNNTAQIEGGEESTSSSLHQHRSFPQPLPQDLHMLTPESVMVWTKNFVLEHPWFVLGVIAVIGLLITIIYLQHERGAKVQDVMKENGMGWITRPWLGEKEQREDDEEEEEYRGDYYDDDNGSEYSSSSYYSDEDREMGYESDSRSGTPRSRSSSRFR